MELAALEVPIRAPGAQGVQATLRALEQQGARAGRALDTSAKQATAAIAAEVAALRRIGAAAREAAEGEATYQYRLRTKLAALKGTTDATLQAAAAQRRATEEWVRAARVQQTAAAQTVGTSTALVAVGRSSRATEGAFRSMARTLAGTAAAELGFRTGLGSLGVTLGTLAAGSAITLGVVAGLAAIALAFQRVRDRAREAREAAATAMEEALKLARENLPEVQRAGIGVSEAEREQRAADRAVARAMEQLREAQAAEALALETLQRVQATGVASSDALSIAMRTAELAAGRRRAAQEAVTQAEAHQLLAVNQLAAARKTLTDAEREAADAQRRLAEEMARARQQEIQALASLAQAGLATSEDLDRLRTIQEALAEATRTGTAEARAQALALLEVVKAARAARAEGILFGVMGAPPKPQLSKTTPPDTRPRREGTRIQASDDELRQRGFNPAPAPGVSGEDAYKKWYDSLDPGKQKLEDFRQGIGAALDQMTSLPSVLMMASDAFLQLWEAIGSGDANAIKAVLAAQARQLAQMSAAKALYSLAEGILFGDPKKFAAAKLFGAAAIAFSVMAGALGGGGRGAGGGGGRSSGSRLQDREESFVVGPALSPGGRSRTAAGAYRLTPAEPVVVNQTFYGTDRDPKVHDWFAKNMRQAQRRGMG